MSTAYRRTWSFCPVLLAGCLFASAPASADPVSTDALRHVLAGTLTPDQVDQVMSSPDTVDRLTGWLSFMRDPMGAAARLVISVTHQEPDREVVVLSLYRTGIFQRHDGDFPVSESQDFMLDRIQVAMPPPQTPRSRPARRVAPKPSPPSATAPVVLPKATGTRVCSPDQSACWQNTTRRFLDEHPPACEPYLIEEQTHIKSLSRIGDPNYTTPIVPDDLEGPFREREARMREVAGPYPGGAMSPNPLVSPATATITNEPPVRVPPPEKPSARCLTEWNGDLDLVIPTLSCTRAVLACARYVDGDPLAAMAEWPLSPISSIPGLSHYLHFKARAISADRSWEGAWALRWMDRALVHTRKGNGNYVRQAMKSVATRPDEQRVLAFHLRQWAADERRPGYQAIIDRIYREHFLELYPGMADARGLPDITRFPTRLWWATNWLAVLKRSGIPPREGIAWLKCQPDGQAMDVLRDLLPYLSERPRFAPLARELLSCLQ